MSENQTGKYFKYAIGEIILVVIGILIALSINNWNENEKLKQKEVSVAKEIYNELNQNIESVKNQLKLWDERNKNVYKISDLITSENIEIEQREFDSIMVYVVSYNNFKLKNSKFSKIIASENFEFKKSKKVITEMLSLNDDYNTLMAYYEFNVANYHDIIQPYLIKNYSFRNMANVVFGKKNNSKIDFRELLSDIEFDNVIQSVKGNNAPFVQFIKNTIVKREYFKLTLEETYPIITKNTDD